MNKYLSSTLLAFGLAAGAASAVAAESEATPAAVIRESAVVKLGTGFDYSRGKYGFTQATEVLSVPANLSFDQNRWSFRASIPYITIKGPATVVAGQSPVAAPARPTTKYQSGLGDPTASATYHVHPVVGEWNFDVTGRAKFGTADEAEGLGTGENDYYAQVDFYKSYGTFIPFVSAGYRFLGSNAAFPLKDGPYASVGGSFIVAPGTIVGAAFDWRSKIIDGAEDGIDTIGFFSTELSPKWNLLGYVLIGFNDATPDIGIGSALTYKF